MPSDSLIRLGLKIGLCGIRWFESMRQTGLIFAFAMLGTCGSALADRADAIIGNTPIVLPDTAVLLKHSEESVSRLAKRPLTSGRRLLVVWLDSRERIRSDHYFPDRGRYAVSYTIAALESRDATPGDFAQVKRAVREDLAKVRAGGEGRMPESLAELRQQLREKGIDHDRGISFAPAIVKPLADSENQLSYLILVPTKFTEQNGRIGEAWLLLCSSQLLVRRKVVGVDVFSLYSDHSDSAWVAKECNELVQSVLSANK